MSKSTSTSLVPIDMTQLPSTQVGSDDTLHVRPLACAVFPGFYELLVFLEACFAGP